MLMGVSLSSKATLVPSELPSQLIKTLLQSPASRRGRGLEWTLRSMSSSKLHWLDFPLTVETNSTSVESCSFMNSEPSTRRPSGTGLKKGNKGRVRDVYYKCLYFNRNTFELKPDSKDRKKI